MNNIVNRTAYFVKTIHKKIYYLYYLKLYDKFYNIMVL